MRQLFQNLKNGETILVNAPVPKLAEDHILISTTKSLISSGTERMLVNFGKSSLIAKAKSQPEKVTQVLEKAKTEGLLSTVDAVRSKLEKPIPLGYSNVGIVTESRATGFSQGDRVVSNGPHADVVAVSKNLCARIPDNVSDEEASFTVIASIGLQGIRLAKPTLGEVFVVIGVGLIGLLTVQMLRANGCKVLAIDFSSQKLELARSFGAHVCNLSDGEDPVSLSMDITGGRGVDGVLITAATNSDKPINQAANMCRRRGRIILVGVSGLNIKRSDFYEKELSFQVSCSYGPGRYDPVYEEKGIDYPLGFVRWTEQRNFEAVLDMMSAKSIDVSSLISHRFPFLDCVEAYNLLTQENSALAILLDYNHEIKIRHCEKVTFSEKISIGSEQAVIGFIGAGNYASRVLIPEFKRSGAFLHTIASVGGASAAIQAKHYAFSNATSNIDQISSNPDINTVVIATRHDSHAPLTINALNAGKNVYVEKPLALTRDELSEIKSAISKNSQHLMVGFNRRFSPLVVTMKNLLSKIKSPKSFIMLMNAGYIHPSHWVHDPKVGGGRIIGEACHYIDLMRHLAGCPIISCTAQRMGNSENESLVDDKACITLGFSDGSFGTIHYLANGGSSFPKERIEVFCGGANLLLDNFKSLRGFNWPGFKKKKLWKQDKGHRDCTKAFIDTIKNGTEQPIPLDEIFEVAETSIDAWEILKNQRQ